MTLPLLGQALRGGTGVNDLRTRLKMADTEERKWILAQERERIVQERAAKMDDARIKLLEMQTGVTKQSLDSGAIDLGRKMEGDKLYTPAMEFKDASAIRAGEVATANATVLEKDPAVIKRKLDEAVKEYERIDAEWEHKKNTMSFETWQNGRTKDLAPLEDKMKQLDIAWKQTQITAGGLSNQIQQKVLDTPMQYVPGGTNEPMPQGGPLAGGQPGGLSQLPAPDVFERYPSGEIKTSAGPVNIKQGEDWYDAGATPPTVDPMLPNKSDPYEMSLWNTREYYRQLLNNDFVGSPTFETHNSAFQTSNQAYAMNKKHNQDIVLFGGDSAEMHTYFNDGTAAGEYKKANTSYKAKVAKYQQYINRLKQAGLAEEAAAEQKALTAYINAMLKREKSGKNLWEKEGNQQKANPDGTTNTGIRGNPKFFIVGEKPDMEPL